ncbi:methyltransferase type 11 [Proteiniphilum saccharofermentans]|uniref:Arsenite methyltransferase n=1 Tax=Proteiniphilum saccharofermentans TaxID=1642647 RepID=A0A1R3SVM2_9BACT|nr:class I SAM-dependent methyltransferase [Proteiniphilum saccharofermentans]SCD19611.1 methyltransferase type 11 [Proteiniphilum saccharofermentans]
MNNQNNTHLHPLENASALESRFRRLLQNPRRILKKYIRQGMTVLDLGCGPGFFTLEIAKLVGEEGKVIAVDVQEGMLEILKQKLKGSELKERIQILKNEPQSLGFSEKVDFILAFYSFHEMKHIDHIIQALKEVMKPNTEILISEQKMHVSKDVFKSIVIRMINNGFVVCRRPKIFFSRSVVMKIGK